MSSLSRRHFVPEIAEAYGVNQTKVIGWIHAGELKAVNIAAKRNGRPRWAITPEALQEFEAKRSSSPEQSKPAPRRKRPPVMEEFV